MSIDQPEVRKTDQVTLESWKEIAEYLQRNTTTARRWEKEEGLPVHRHPHKSRNSVYAYPSEIDAWRASLRVVAQQPARPWWRPLAFAATLILCLVMVGNGIRPQVASAQQATVQTRRVWADAKGGGADALSPDGRYVSFTDWDTGNLAVHDLASGANRPLTNTGGWKASDPGYVERSSLISRDGSQVAYVWWDYKTSHVEIRMVPLHSTEITAPRIVRQNAEDSGIALFGWSPDAKLLYLERALPDKTTQLAVLSIQDGSFRVLKTLGWLAAQAKLSPDGRYIAYDRPVGNGAPSSDIVLLASDGSQENVIVEHPAKDFSPMWSPSGREVLFLSDRTGRTSLWSVAVEGGKARGAPSLVKADVGAMLPLDIARDGTLYYRPDTGGGRNVFLAEVDSDLKITKAPTPAAERFLNFNFHPSWSPDGEHIAYYSGREGAYQRAIGPLAPEVATVLVIRSARTGEERDIRLPLQVSAYSVLAEPKWFPDGRSVLVVGWVSERPGFGYFRVDLASGKTELLYRPEGLGLSTGRLDLSPDGKSIYYLDRALMRFDIETRRVTEIRKIDVSEAQIAVSPDGEQIAVAYRTADDPQDTLAIVPITGEELRAIFRHKSGESHSSTLAWTPDQRFLLFAERDKDSKSSLWRVPVAGGEAEKGAVSVKGTLSTARVHPGGRRLVYETIERVPDEVWALENFLPRSTGAK